MSVPRLLGIGIGGLVLGTVLLAGLVSVVGVPLLGDGGSVGSGSVGGGAGPSSAGNSGAIPAAMLTLYEGAATTCPGLSWAVLAAIGTVESGNGTSNLPGVHAGANPAGAEGPMQFEPATFASYDEPVPPGGMSPPSPYDPVDAVFAAARMLCADGAGDAAHLPAAIYAYNHSAAYVEEVLDLAVSYEQTASQNPSPAVSPTPSPVPGASGSHGADEGSAVGPVSATATVMPAGAIAVIWALAQVGTPYVWGGESPDVGFDCSGLTQAAYRVAGIALPRVAQDQFARGPQLAPGTPLQPGDLVFFGGGTRDVEHVGLFIGSEDGHALMVDAPRSGDLVRVETFPSTVGAKWGAEGYVGATRPGV